MHVYPVIFPFRNAKKEKEKNVKHSFGFVVSVGVLTETRQGMKTGRSKQWELQPMVE